MGPHPGSKTSYPNTTSTKRAKLPGGGKSARSTRHDTLYPGPFQTRDDHLAGSVEGRIENEYGKREAKRSMKSWPLLRGRGFANTYYR